MSNGPTRIEALEVENFRALRDFRLTDMTPLTVLTGPNGSGKFTIVDVFAFLSERFLTPFARHGKRVKWERMFPEHMCRACNGEAR